MNNRLLNSQIRLTYFVNYLAQFTEFLGLYTSITGSYEHESSKIVIGIGSILFSKFGGNYSRLLRSDLNKKRFIPVETSRINLESVINN